MINILSFNAKYVIKHAKELQIHQCLFSWKHWSQIIVEFLRQNIRNNYLSSKGILSGRMLNYPTESAALPKERAYSEFFWFIFSSVGTEYGDVLCKYECGHFLRSASSYVLWTFFGKSLCFWVVFSAFSLFDNDCLAVCNESGWNSFFLGSFDSCVWCDDAFDLKFNDI